MSMAPARDEGSNAAALAELLRAVQADPSAFDFYALLRRVDSLRRQLPRTGEAPRPRQEALRLGQAAELDFAPAPLHGLQWREGTAPRLLVRFFGLLGPMGPMPLHFTETVRERLLHHGDTTLARFLDLFHHRTLSLFFRAWAQAQPVVHLDRPGEDRFRVWVGALAGIPPSASPSGTPEPAARSGLPPAALVYQAGWLMSRSRHPEMLAKVISQFFGVQARIEEHVGQWLPIGSDDRSRLAFARNRAERSQTPQAGLGRSANAGSRVWDRQYRFRLHLGPLTHAQTLTFLPGGKLVCEERVGRQARLGGIGPLIARLRALSRRGPIELPPILTAGTATRRRTGDRSGRSSRCCCAWRRSSDRPPGRSG